MKTLLFAGILSTLLLTACTSPVEPQPSGIEAPGLWSRLTSPSIEAIPLLLDEKKEIEQQWWKHFADPTLDALIAEALKNNKTLAIATARVEEARAGRTGAVSLLAPQISGVVSSQRANQGFFTNDKPITVHEASVEASWELDLFGRNQARVGAATAILESEEASRQAVTVALLAEVARNYFDLRNYEKQILITKQNLQTQQKTLELVNIQMEGALVSDFDVQRTAAQVSSTESLLPSLQIAYDTTLNRLNVLIGAVPGAKDSLMGEAQAFAPLDVQTVIAAPSAVLANRPDVRAAERAFAASISNRKAATAELFPNVSLLALFGVQDGSVMSASPWGITGTLVQPILNFGRITSQIDIADSRQQQALLSYQQTVLEALEDMENALSNYLNETGRNRSLDQAVVQSRKATELAKEQYTSGYNGLLDVLVSERSLLDAESSFATSDAKLRKDLVNIYTAAGGGWK